ncbi:vanadium-dependent haloperoxidase [Xinfangfangia pollutisoli]|uniref:vanadium-dependent haloperoxidase n=1 Tax=Xinfangfangia pollutisoli TaxID=2865960 RepID=UPI001CD6F0DD|nr:vanadium-dependent haloperoxidase [Xinfangfangia pollutisoli]
MRMIRSLACLALSLTLTCGLLAAPARAGDPAEVMQQWYRLVLELVRHTATYSPPVAARAFAYTGIIAHEAQVGGPGGGVTLAGQVNELTALPARDPGLAYDEAIVLNAALTEAVDAFFFNTGPTGQRAMEAMDKALSAQLAEGVDPQVLRRSVDHGQAVARHIIAWSDGDGGAVIDNMGFPETWVLTPGPAHWVPTSTVALQQKPLLPYWGNLRPFALPDGATCGLPPPPDYSEDPGSDFYREAKEVYDAVNALTPEQTAIARFWSDDPMLSPTPPGHWISIAMTELQIEGADGPRWGAVMARLGITLADSFIGCWHTKFEYDLVRPVTYINRVIDPNWQPILITPPFPEYPSGHSTQSGAAAEVLAAVFGADHAFVDGTHLDDGIPERAFASFQAAAEEAAISRLYGGIHFRAAIERGLTQGACIGAYAVALRMSE